MFSLEKNVFKVFLGNIFALNTEHFKIKFLIKMYIIFIALYCGKVKQKKSYKRKNSWKQFQWELGKYITNKIFKINIR